jgi:serine protease Do
MPTRRVLSPIAVLLIALLAGLVGGAVGTYLCLSHWSSPKSGEIGAPATLPARPVGVSTEQDEIVEAVARAEAAVVKIETISTPGPRNMWDYMRGPMPQPGLGSGFIFKYEDRFLVLTNAHVVAEAQQIAIELVDGHRFSGRLIGAEIATDLAVVEPVDPPDELTALELGDSDATSVGEWVIAMGNPFGYTGTVTVGVVSAKGYRPVGPDRQRDVIQTDAAINRGNSGGPLINLRGQAVGVNYAIFSPTPEATSIGISFAIPINEAKMMAHFLIHGGPWVGIGDIMPNSPGFAHATGLDTDEGVVTMNVIEGSPAQKAGLRSGDVIIAIRNQPIQNGEQLREAILAHTIGEQIEMLINRAAEEQTVMVTAGRIPR